MRTTNWVIDVLECILRCILPSCILLIELVYVVYKLFAFPKTVLLVHNVIKGRILFGLELVYLYYYIIRPRSCGSGLQLKLWKKNLTHRPSVFCTTRCPNKFANFYTECLLERASCLVVVSLAKNTPSLDIFLQVKTCLQYKQSSICRWLLMMK